MTRRAAWQAVCGAVAASAVLSSVACAGRPAATHGPWTADEALQPADLVATLRGGESRPTVVYVGYLALFHPGRIPGATFHGPAAEPGGLADLKRWGSSQSKDSPVVIYCGCCPSEDCPNVVPAYGALKELGFSKIRVLILPTNFETDWVEKGYPIER
jgi:hypothetical protein